MKNTVFTTVISVTVLVLDIKKKTAELKISFNSGKVTRLTGVDVSGLLVWKFTNDVNYEVGREYECTIASTEWMAMPFQLICYGSSDEVKYLLECVNVKKSTKLTSTDTLGNELVDYKNNYYKSNQYRRYRNYVGMVRS